MLVLAVGSKLITRKLSTDLKRSRWQNLAGNRRHYHRETDRRSGPESPKKYLGFLGTLFLFVAAASLCTVIPGYEPPTGSLSTTAALALCVFVAVPLFGIEEQGVGGYLKSYMKPTFIMLPFNIISEISRTLALAVRLFGNMMSGAMIIGILLTITPFIFPIVMTCSVCSPAWCRPTSSASWPRFTSRPPHERASPSPDPVGPDATIESQRYNP
jgi:F-type H+-transporting ATPase subunit a